jgi:hypothetical protein
MIAVRHQIGFTGATAEVKDNGIPASAIDGADHTFHIGFVSAGFESVDKEYEFIGADLGPVEVNKIVIRG